MTVQDERCYAGLTGEHSGLSNSLAGKLSMKVKTIYICINKFKEATYFEYNSACFYNKFYIKSSRV